MHTNLTTTVQRKENNANFILPMLSFCLVKYLLLQKVCMRNGGFVQKHKTYYDLKYYNNTLKGQ